MTAATAPAALPAPALREYVLLGVLATLWAASYSFIKVGVETIPPVTFIAARTLIAGLLLLAIMRARGVALPLDRRTLGMFAFQALMNSVLPFTLIAWGEQVVDAGLATILNSTTPLFAFLIAWLWLGQDRPSPGKLLGLAAGLAGTVLIVGPHAFGALGEQGLAQLAIVVATISYAVAALFGRRFKGYDPMVPAAGSMICGAAVLIPLSLAVDRPWALSPSADSLWALLGLSVFSTALAFVIYFRLLRTLGAVATTTQAFLRVPVGVLIGCLVLGETLATTAYAGLVLVVIGVAAMTLSGRRKPA